MMLYILRHTTIGFHWLDLFAAIILIVVIVAFVWNRHKLRKQEKELEDKLAELYTNETTTIEDEERIETETME